VFIAMKGPNVEPEMEDGKAALFALGAKLQGIKEVSLPYQQGERSIIFAFKVSPTPGRFPRKTGDAQSHPITRN
jgi:16S rRNA (guanine527-N7)-methyltransferase